MGNFEKIFSQYKTYDDSRGRGGVAEWRDAFEARMGIDEAKRIMRESDPLKTLGLDKMPSIHELKNLYRKLMKEHHPDKGGDPQKCKKIIAAYTVLERRIEHV
jgi:hypothetical protein